MGECKIDHSIEDVKSKYESQVAYLPEDVKASFSDFFKAEHTQEILNDVFHLLKKYDLVDEEERETRNKRLTLVLKNL
ncbi:group-specific protein [Robertmurraya kyonggiensis]|uniref:Group-specific protein n=1 Tax=Robertmurraya kyonggiensis TaxID=1037680 RepID=A0A4U1DB32_9BACI|nr:group-specific protein [Robertmurraya kyonggiensis]TKC18807.1 group-specific protein [Robertmurraya kyonggiensis]